MRQGPSGRSLQSLQRRDVANDKRYTRTMRAVPGGLLRWLPHVHQQVWWTRAVTLGVRAVVLDDGRVFLVRHTYRPGWYLPGGAVDRRETAEAAAIRELEEEGGLHAEERPRLHGFYRNGRRDYVACYVIRRVRRRTAFVPNWEIADAGFFPIDALPDGTTRATRARLAEVLDECPIATDW